jgi:hypothetical protein
MASIMKSNIVYQYFKKEEGGNTIYIQVDTLTLKGAQLTVPPEGDMALEEVDFAANILDSLTENGYTPANALEFHLILKGLG